MNRNGMTLVELLIYIVLFSVVAVLMGNQMRSSMRNFSGGKTAALLQSGSRDLIAVMSRDIRNTGFKRAIVLSGGKYRDTLLSKAYISDSSSFEHKEGNPGDTLTVYKATLSDAGLYKNVDTIKYYLDGKVLKRKAGNSADRSLADNVHALQFEYGVFSANDTLLHNWSGTSDITVSGASNCSLTCATGFTISAERNVRVSFNMTFDKDFEKNLDSLKWVIVSGASVLGSEVFKIAGSAAGIKIPVSAGTNAKLRLKCRTHGKGKLTINSVRVQSADLGKYEWSYAPVPAKKKNVKAIRIHALVRSDKKGETVTSTSIAVGNVTVSRSGQYSWRLYSEIVEIPNNGKF